MAAAALLIGALCSAASPARADTGGDVVHADGAAIPVIGQPYCPDAGGAAVDAGIRHPSDASVAGKAVKVEWAFLGDDSQIETQGVIYGRTDATGRFMTTVTLSRSASTSIAVFADAGAEGTDWVDLGGRQYTFPDGCLPGYPRMTMPFPVVGQDWIIDDPAVEGDARWDADKVYDAPPNATVTFSLTAQGELIGTATPLYKFHTGSSRFTYGTPDDVYIAPPKPPVTKVCVLETGPGWVKVEYGGVLRKITVDPRRSVPKVCVTPEQAAAWKKKFGA